LDSGATNHIAFDSQFLTHTSSSFVSFVVTMSLMEIGFALLVLARYAGDPDAEKTVLIMWVGVNRVLV